MKFSDIVALAKAGYRPADVKELLDLCETDPETKKKDPEPEKKEEIPEKKEQEKEPEEDIFMKLAKENI